MDVDYGALYHTLYVLTFSTSLGYLSIPCNKFLFVTIICYKTFSQVFIVLLRSDAESKRKFIFVDIVACRTFQTEG